SLAAGQRAAMIMSLLETAKANGHEPWVWLRDVLSRLPSWPNSKRPVISPCSSSPAHARYCFLIFTWRLTP
ncbi:transposase domain-containing protein, partial [Photorhabdus noenieputensis]|uniref:transposase domain-containing protein n=1 Tax=Photorhabdus noenieputensis TaxID=1208607 RepID=UPI001FD16A0E